MEECGGAVENTGASLSWLRREFEMDHRGGVRRKA